jgi:hypothetical protein
VARTILQDIEELSEDRDRLLAREGAHRATATDQQRILRVDHDLEVLWDLRRRELAGEVVDVHHDHYDRYTVDPGGDPPPSSSA